MSEYTYEAGTGTVHIVNRYEERGDEEQINAVTECGNTYEIDEIDDPRDTDELDVCGNCQ